MYFCPRPRSVLTWLLVPLRGPSLLPASLSRPQPSESEPDTEPGSQEGLRQSSRNSRRKLSCAQSPGSGSDKLHQPAEESEAAPAETTEPPSGSGRKARRTRAQKLQITQICELLASCLSQKAQVFSITVSLIFARM